MAYQNIRLPVDQLPAFYHDNLTLYQQNILLRWDPPYLAAYNRYQQARDARYRLSSFQLPPHERAEQTACLTAMLEAEEGMRMELAVMAWGMIAEAEARAAWKAGGGRME